MARIAIALALAALVAPSAASAKELIKATVCGDSGCRTIRDRATLNEIPGGEEATPLRAPALYYRLVLVGGEPGGRRFSFTSYYVPSAKAMAFADEGLVRLHPIYGPRANGVMRRITAGIEPYAPPPITTAIVGGRRVTGAAASSYASLFTVGKRSPLGASPDDWVAVDLRSKRPSPWTDGRNELMFSPSEELIEIAWEQRRIPGAIAEDVAAGRVLHEEQDRTFPWPWLAFAGVGVLAALSLARILPSKS